MFMTLLCFCHNLVKTRKGILLIAVGVQFLLVSNDLNEYSKIENMFMTPLPLTQTR